MSLVFANQVQDYPHVADYVSKVFWIIYQDALPRDPKRVFGIRYCQVLNGTLGRKGNRVWSSSEPILAHNATGLGGKAVRGYQGSGRTDRQRVEWVGQFRCKCCIKGDADVPATKDTPNGV